MPGAELQNYKAHITTKLTPDQRMGVLKRSAELGLKPGEYVRKVLVESLGISSDGRILLEEQCGSHHFHSLLMIAWLREQPISQDLLDGFKEESERIKARLAEAAISRARGVAE